ncbi:MAG: hypothetical protein C7B43_18465 [Sulfobacillus benefaciens]|uniref:Uncharacterized protein n=1 Tax=Sulfobacillus benefaciens TaxID=453960 RepID=A0A2T2WR26_9FIRM|nr:MAG: hypothetical protein C7B43_18465 [Sulfobacillus benefaciens]
MSGYDLHRWLSWQRGKIPKPSRGQRRSPSQNKVRILERLGKDAVLRFPDDVMVPFTNHLAKPDFHMRKARQHVSRSL